MGAEAGCADFSPRYDERNGRMITMAFMQGVKEVLKAKNRKDLRGIRGAVAELVKVPADVEVAIETALGGACKISLSRPKRMAVKLSPS